MEEVVLVDEQDRVIGAAPKATVHAAHTPLHRAFSIFVFNAKGQLLATQRALSKKTFPGLWSNTVCGHPSPGEEAHEAASRRLLDELNISVRDVQEVSPYRYQFFDQNGIMENEICPVFIGYADVDPRPAQQEVEDWRWMNWEDFLRDIAQYPTLYSPWCREEAMLVKAYLARK